MDLNITADLALILPELLLVSGALLLLLLGVFLNRGAYQIVMGLTLALLMAAIILIILFSQNSDAFHGALRLDAFSDLMKILILIGSITSLALSVDFFRAENNLSFEFPILCLFAIIGMMIMVSAGNFLALYMGLELQSLSLYSLAAFQRNDGRASEAGLKYFVLGSLSSGLLLYGISLLYGFVGTVDFSELSYTLSQQEPEIGIIIAMVFIFSGIAFKISAVPFHMWTPDVYEGAPTAVTAFFATAPKIAALAVVVRLVISVFAPVQSFNGAMPPWQQIIVFLALASMALSAFGGIGQTNIKRLLAYSSIGHVGYALVALAAGTQTGIAAFIVYIIIYLASTIGCFAFVLGMRRSEGLCEDIYDLSGLAQKKPFMAIMMTIQLFSLMGIPPLSGFFGKWYSFLAAIEAHLVPLAVLGVLASVIAAFYYLRLIKIIWFDEPKAPFLTLPLEINLILGLSGLFTVCYMFFGREILNLAQNTANIFF